jgi:hypothetical protein
VWLWILGFAVFAMFMTLRLTTAEALSIEPWDAGWYKSVAESGYAFDGDHLKQQNVVFFPAIPIVVSLATPVLFGNVHLAMLAVSLAFTAAGLSLWYRALRCLYAPPVPAMATALVIAYPFSLFLLAGYGESALFFSTAGFFHYWSARRRPLVAGAFIGLAALAKPAGILLVFVPLVELAWTTFRASAGWREALAAIHRDRLAWFVMPAIAVSGLIAFQAYLWRRFGDPVVYKHLGGAWNADLGAPMLADVLTLQGLFDVSGHLLTNPLNNPISWGTLAVIALPLLALKWWASMPRAFWIECAVLSAVLCLVAFPQKVFYQNAGRYALMFLPGFVALALSMMASDSIRRERGGPLVISVVLPADDAGPRVPTAFWLWMALSLALFARFVVMFYRVEWVS